MADARSKAEWAQTSTVLAMIANVNRDPKKRRRPYTSDEFNPHFVGNVRKKPITFTKENVQMLRAFLPK